MNNEKRIYTIGTAHLDTVWNWDFEYVIDTCLKNTLNDNFALFEKYPDLESFCDAEVEDIEKLIYSCGFYKTKAKDIKEMAIMIRDVFDGRVPDTIEKLTSLPGVGRKTANLIMGDVYKQPAIVADTHLIRITNLIGLVETKDPKKVELELKKIIAGDKSNDFCHRMVLHGRAVCIARRTQCNRCCIKEYCKTGSKV